MDLSPLRPNIEELDIFLLSINDLEVFEKGFSKLRVLIIVFLDIDDLSPLVALPSLDKLDCGGIAGWNMEDHDVKYYTSLAPLVRRRRLKKLRCTFDQTILDELEWKRGDVQ